MAEAHNRGKGAAVKWLRDHLGYRGHECLLWPFSKQPTGYGSFGYLGKVHYAHRFMCELANGEQPSSRHEVAHSCGNRSCCNPHHLSWKTSAGNQFDRRLHGTMRTGRKLTGKEWAEIRSLKGKMTQRQIADLYGVSFQAVSHLHRKPPHRVQHTW